jgi:hypothetical protein
MDGRRSHIFNCAAKMCRHKSRGVRRFLDKGDAKSTSNMRKHTKKCWGEEMVAAADKLHFAADVRATMLDGVLNPESITAAFERKGKGRVTFSHRKHTKPEAR